MNKTTPLQGIVRNLPDSVVADGAMQEVINLRPEDGAWRPVGRKMTTPTTSSDVRYIHAVNETYKVHLGTPGGVLWYWVFRDGQVIRSASTGINLVGKQVGFCQLHNTLMLINKTDRLNDLFIFNVDTERYQVLQNAIIDLPDLWFDGVVVSETLDFFVDVTGMTAKEKAAAANEIIAHWAEKYHSGKIAIRYAWELSDGTISKPSAPVFMEASYFRISDSTNQMRGRYRNIRYGTNTTKEERTIIKNYYDGIIRSLNIYVTRIYAPIPGGSGQYDAPVFNELNINSKETGFYLIHSIPLDGLDNDDNWSRTFTFPGVGQEGDKFLQGPFDGLETKPSMSTDNFTHHVISGRNSYAYNGRIWLGDIMTRLYGGYDPKQMLAPLGPATHPGQASYNVTFETELYTSDGIKTVTRMGEVNLYHDFAEYPDDPEAPQPDPIIRPAFQLKRYFAYPDARARRLRIYIYRPGDQQRLVANLNLTPHETLNFSAYLEESTVDGETIKGRFVFDSEINTLPIQSPGNVDDTYTDSNRIQATELDNPFVFPAVNSYRVGNGTVLGMATNAIAMSQGQFGQYPVYCFCSDGIYALMIGSGDPLVQSVAPVSRIVCNNPLSITQVDGGVAFTTKRGLFIISGPRPEAISPPAEGKHLSRLEGTVNYEAIIDNANVYQAKNYLCNTEFLDYLSGAVIGYDFNEDRPELIITNPTKAYSWVYSLQGKSWFKISESFERVVPDYPLYYGYRHIEVPGTTPFLASSEDIPASSDLVLASFSEYAEGTINYQLCDLSQEDFTQPITVYMETRPMKLSGHKLKKLKAMLVSGVINDIRNNSFAVNLFGSTNDRSWFLLNNSKAFASKERMLIGRSTHSCMYYILVIGGKVDRESFFTHLEVDFEERFGGKLR